MITTAQTISFGISIIAVLITIYTLVKNGTKEDSSALTTVIVKLENIESICKDNQRESKEIRDDMNKLDKRVTKIETLMEEDGR
jgi:peptidoglycan hydrolase CwlO-like protein